jgi:hypothetical protein
MTDITAEAAEAEQGPDWDERWQNLMDRVDPHGAVALAAVSGLGLIATFAVAGTQFHDWLERDQGLRGAAVPMTFLLLAVVGFWAGFLPFRTARHLIFDVPAITATVIVFYGVQWGMIPAVHPQTVSDDPAPVRAPAWRGKHRLFKNQKFTRR